MFKLSNRMIEILIFFFSFLFSIILIKILMTPGLWYKFFIFLNVPAGGTDIADAKSLQYYSEKFYTNGLVPPDTLDFWKRSFVSINIIWLKLSIIFKFHIYNNFHIFIFVMFFCYIYSVLKIATINKKFVDFFIIFLAFLSTSSFYLIERGNVDLIIFSLTTLLVFINNKLIRLLLAVLLSFLKINLIYVFIIFIKNLKKLYFIIFLILTIIIINYKYIFFGYNEIGSAADGLHYGVFTISKSILHTLSKTLNLTININQVNTKFGFLLLFFFIPLILYYFIKNLNIFKINFDKTKIYLTKKEELLILGSVFYIFSFLFFSAPDYKLVFLILTLPFFLEEKKLFLLEIFLIFLLLNTSIIEVFAFKGSIFNLNVAEIYSKFSYRYYFFGILNHLLKIFLFLILLNRVIQLYKEKIIYN